jgi:hypothetical protein
LPYLADGGTFFAVDEPEPGPASLRLSKGTQAIEAVAGPAWGGGWNFIIFGFTWFYREGRRVRTRGLLCWQLQLHQPE